MNAMSRRAGLAVAVLGLVAGVAGPARAALIIDQSGGALGATSSTISQVFTDFTTFSTASFDDFTLAGPAALTTFTAFGFEQGNPALNVAVTAEIRSTADFTTAPLLSSVSGSQVGSNLVLDFGGQVLAAGTYWITAYVTRPFAGGGQWFFLNRTPPDGSPAFLHNPDGGTGLGTSPLVNPSSRDLVFTLEGTFQTAAVPEPSTLLGGILGVGLCGGGWRLKRRRRSLDLA